mmetsp:Transcript_1158/g.2093  ORF Transcript_1158/g.2093 Transcript_1158/m.2093 type:complete len:468 (-) Transcript_1158:2020-3423(-)
MQQPNLNANAQTFVPSSRRSFPRSCDASDLPGTAADIILPEDLTDAFTSDLSLQEGNGGFEKQATAAAATSGGGAAPFSLEQALASSQPYQNIGLQYVENNCHVVNPSPYGHHHGDFCRPGPGDESPVSVQPTQVARHFENEEYNAFMQLLQEEFPEFDAQSLAEILEANDFNVSVTIDVLTQLELLETGSEQCHNGAEAPQLVSQVAPALNDLNFPSLSSKGDKKDKADNNTVMGFEETGYANAAKIVAKEPAPQSVTHASGRSGYRHPYESGHHVPYGGSRAENRAPQAQAHVPWVETGESVARQYAELRQDAVGHMKARNRYFEQATLAYQSGNKQLASQLSRQGHYHAELMKAEHAKAASSIFHQRNRVMQSNTGDVLSVDLHGLHVKEALYFLNTTMAQQMSSGISCLKLNVLVGTAHHTKARHSSMGLQEAVEGFCSEQGIPYTYQNGVLQITCSSRSYVR